MQKQRTAPAGTDIASKAAKPGETIRIPDTNLDAIEKAEQAEAKAKVKRSPCGCGDW